MLGILGLSMFGISNSANYIAVNMGSMSLISIIISFVIVYPSARYYVQISTYIDYDFSNLFIQCMVVKLFVTAIMVIVYGIINGGDLWVSKGGIGVVGVRLLVIMLYLIFMAVNRFATRFSNFKFFCGLILIGSIAKLFL